VTGLDLQLSVHYQDHFQLQLDTTLPATGVTAIYGPSGSGKSTLLNCIAGLQAAASGSRIRFAGDTWQDRGVLVPPWQRTVGYVFQDARLFPHLSVEDNLLYGARRRGPDTLSLAQVSSWLELDALRPRSCAGLSGGQRQRVAIGRALLSGSRLLLLDEPLTGLDQAARREILQHLQRLRRETATPMLYVSHDIDEITQLADHVVLLDQGRVEARGSLLELSARLDTSLSRQEQAGAILDAVVSGQDREFGLSVLDLEGQPLYVSQLAAAAGEHYRIRIPARDVSICRERPAASSILNILPVELVEIGAGDASRVLLRLRLGQQHLLARITRRSCRLLGLAVGDALFAQVKSVALLGESGRMAP
jgi:molybdate transport system ATP-binding protein